jgi:excinuclease ABC subunit A
LADHIVIKGAREHNLKNINITLPRDKFIVMTGVSGSGKSSLAFDTIYAEGQRRYMESLSAYARQFLGQMQKPDVDSIEGLSPAIAIEQKSAGSNPRSTVGTITEIYDYFRLLWARIGVPYCPNDGTQIKAQSVQQIVDRVLEMKDGTKIMVLAPVISGRKGEYSKLFENVKKEGFLRVRIDGVVKSIEEKITVDRKKKHDVEIVVDRIVVSSSEKKRITQSVELAVKIGEGMAVIHNMDNKKDTLFSEKLSCDKCGFSMQKLEPRLFSFNSPFGACPDCMGIGSRIEVDPRLVVNQELSIQEGALKPWGNRDGYYWHLITGVAEHFNFSVVTPFKDLPDKIKQILLYGSKEKIKFNYKTYASDWNHEGGFEGLVPFLQRRYSNTPTERVRDDIFEKYMVEKECSTCKGKRLKPEAASVQVGGKSIIEVSEYSIEKAVSFFNGLELSPKDEMISRQILKEIKGRLQFLMNVGLSYITLNRKASTISGGEFQRIHLATQIGVGLVGVLYILDEPSIGLHQRDNEKLLATLKELRDLGNTVIVVEHDEDTMRAADYIVDIGPGPGVHGGEIVAEGDLATILRHKTSLTAKYLNSKTKITIEKSKRVADKYIELRGATTNNLKNVNVRFPLGQFICVTGVSGSGKSSLITETLYPALIYEVYRGGYRPEGYKEMAGWQQIDKVIEIDQSPIGRTPRSNPATYTGVFTEIRNIFAETKEAKLRGYDQGRFSFNVKGGRCETCGGDGIIKVEMHFLPDVYVPCEQCSGKRYNRETLEILYKDRSISDVLNMRVEDALEFFTNVPKIQPVLATLNDVGLGYITLGQPATTLSGGEAQRVKLATELCKRSTGRTLYILDEPTTGLHFADIEKLLNVLNKLVELGNTVVVIEHNLDVIKNSDYIIDIGPEGGDKGGTIVAEGTPEEIMRVKNSYTGEFLYRHIYGKKRR